MMIEVRVFIAGQKGWRFRRKFTQQQAQEVANEWLQSGMLVKGSRVSKLYPPSQIKRIDFVTVKPNPSERKQIELARSERLQQLQSN
jgi:hypothetical protein